MCEALRILMKPELDESMEKGMEKGMEVERKILIKLKEGSTDAELIKLGYTSEAIESAKETLKLILA